MKLLIIHALYFSLVVKGVGEKPTDVGELQKIVARSYTHLLSLKYKVIPLHQKVSSILISKKDIDSDRAIVMKDLATLLKKPFFPIKSNPEDVRVLSIVRKEISDLSKSDATDAKLSAQVLSHLSSSLNYEFSTLEAILGVKSQNRKWPERLVSRRLQSLYFSDNIITKAAPNISNEVKHEDFNLNSPIFGDNFTSSDDMLSVVRSLNAESSNDTSGN